MTGKCQKCGAIFHGWALDDPVKRVCEKFGGTVEIMEDTPRETLFDGTDIPRVILAKSIFFQIDLDLIQD